MNYHSIINKTSFTVVWAMTVIFSGCCPTTSLHPLSDSSNLKFDERLSGAWHAEIEDSNAYLHIGKGKDNYTQIQYIEHKKDGTMDKASFIAFPTFIAGDNFLNIQLALLPEGKFDGYIFVMYDLLDNDRLSLFNWDEEIFENAIREGRLKGDITEKLDEYNGEQGQRLKGKSECVRITDDAEHIIQFIESYGKTKIFSNPVGTFERIVGKDTTPQSAVPETEDPHR